MASISSGFKLIEFNFSHNFLYEIPQSIKILVCSNSYKYEFPDELDASDTILFIKMVNLLSMLQ